jgi:hypothetical protein
MKIMRKRLENSVDIGATTKCAVNILEENEALSN